MRHKVIIITLIVLLCVLFGIKAYLNHKETTTYPLQLNFSELLKSDCNSEPKIKFAVSDRINNNCKNPLFFCEAKVKLGMSKEEFDRLNPNKESILFGNVVIPAEVLYNFDEHSKLASVGVRFEMKNFPAADAYLQELLGERRVDITSDNSIVHRIWYYKDSYFYFNYTNFKSIAFPDKYYYLNASNYDYASRRRHSINELALYGHSCDFEFDEAKKSKNSSSSSRQYNYGDSDVYQGSSKQAEDLAAIDAYFGF